jgi:transcriptional regulator NrdR family protein
LPAASIDKEFGLLCLKCESHRLKVYDSRPMNGTVRRYRQCLDCRARFATHEVVVTAELREQRNSKR